MKNANELVHYYPRVTKLLINGTATIARKLFLQ